MSVHPIRETLETEVKVGDEASLVISTVKMENDDTKLRGDKHKSRTLRKQQSRLEDRGEGNREEKLQLFFNLNMTKSGLESHRDERTKYKYARWLIPETNKAKQIWDFYCLLLIIDICIVVPFRLAF